MNSTNEYLMLLRNTNWDEGLTVEQIEEMIATYTAWFDGLKESGKLVGGMPLASGGRIISNPQDRVSDGPFIESKETIGGYIIIRARTLDEAAEIAGTFPPIALGVSVEVRELTGICPVSQRLTEKIDHLSGV